MRMSISGASRSLAALALLALCASCADSKDIEGGEQRVDDSRLGSFADKECPEGYVGYRFPATSARGDSQELAAQRGDENSISHERTAITIKSLTCGTDTATTEALYPGKSTSLDLDDDPPEPGESERKTIADFKSLSLGCNEGVTCNVSSPCEQAGSFSEVVFSCGANDADEDANGDPVEKLYTVTEKNGEGLYALECPDVNVRETREPEVVCIPEVCHGRSRRNMDLQCVVDASKPEVIVDARFTSNPRPLHENFTDEARARIDGLITKKQEFIDASYTNEPLIKGVTYEFDVEVMITGEEIPEVVTFQGWIDGNVEVGAQVKEYERAFRCSLFSFDIRADDTSYTRPIGGYGPNTRLYKKTVQAEVADDCMMYSYRYQSKQTLDYIESTGETDLSGKNGAIDYAFLPFAKLQDNQLHLSYDLEDRTVWHKGLDHESWSQEIRSSTPECAPNPTSFYQRSATYTSYSGSDASASHFDGLAYYSQRRIATMDLGEVVYPHEFYSYADRGRFEFGTLDIVARNDVKTITLEQDMDPVPVDLTFRPGTQYVEPLLLDIGWYLDNSPQDFFQAGSTTKQKAYADVYVYPSGLTAEEREEIRPVLLGSTRLVGGAVRENLTSVSLPISPSVRDKFTQEAGGSEVYIAGEFASFDLFYCLRYDVEFYRSLGLGSPANDYAKYEADANALWHGEGPDFGDNLPGSPLFVSVESEDTDLSALPWRKRGCRVAKTPLIVRVDRYEVPLPYTAGSGFAGFTDNKASGDGTLSGGNDNGQQEDCQGESRMAGCTDTIKGNNSSSGQFQGSHFEYTVNVRRDKDNSGARSVSGDRETKFFGFSLIDPDSLADEKSWPSEDSLKVHKELEITIEPNWENIAKALKGSKAAGIKFVQARVAGLAGLAMAQEFKKRWAKPPVTIVFAITVGVGLAGVIKFSWGQTEDEDGEPIYPCLDETEPCFQPQPDAASFPDAVEDCRGQGGRIAEMSTEREAQAFVSALPNGAGSYWVGAQLGYIHKQKECGNLAIYNSENTAALAVRCKNESRTQHSWLSTGTPISFMGGTTTSPAFPDAVHEADADDLQTQYPYAAAIAYDTTSESLSSALMAEEKNYVCVFDPAAKVINFGWNIKIPVGAAVGMSLSGCTPTDDPGLCLGASLNFLSFAVEFTYDQVFHWFYRDGEDDAFARRGVQTLSAPWYVRIFEGSIFVKLSAILVSFTYTIASYDGITIAEGKLYEYISPLWEDF